MQFKILRALPFLVLFSTFNFGWRDISWLIETLQIYKMHQNTIWNYLHEMSKLCGTFLPFHSHFTRYIRKEKCLLRNSLTEGIIHVFSSRPFLSNGLIVSGSNMREISSVALPRVELRWNAFNLGTTHYCERRNYFIVRVGICHSRHSRRQCKNFASGVNFSRNNAIYNRNESTKYILYWFYLYNCWPTTN